MGFYSLKSVLIRPSTLTFELARIADEQPVKDFNLEASLKQQGVSSGSAGFLGPRQSLRPLVCVLLAEIRLHSRGAG